MQAMQKFIRHFLHEYWFLTRTRFACRHAEVPRLRQTRWLGKTQIFTNQPTLKKKSIWWTLKTRLVPIPVLSFSALCHAGKTDEVLASRIDQLQQQTTVLARKKNSLLRKILDLFLLSWRLTWLVLRYVPFLVAYPLTFLSVRFSKFWWRRLVLSVENSGPALMKFGQWASTRRDLFSTELCDQFSKLHRKVSTHSWSHTVRKLQNAFGKDWRKIFVKIDKEPIGSGCVAQVYKAYINANIIDDEDLLQEIYEDLELEVNDSIDVFEGLEILGFGHIFSYDDHSTDHEVDESHESPDFIPVAIKVLHPGVYRAVEKDLFILKKFSQIVEWLIPSLKWLSLTECMQEFTVLMQKQIDLRYEAENLEIFNSNFEDVPSIKFPIPIRPYVRRNILVETFEVKHDGNHISEYIGKVVNSDKDESCLTMLNNTLAGYGADALLKMIFADNFVHCDLHPGNILVQHAQDFTEEPENKMTLVDLGDTVIVNVKPIISPVKLVLLDVGITASLSEKDQQNFQDVFKAVVMGQGEVVAQLLLNHARYQECSDVDGFKSNMADLVNRVRENTISLKKLQVGQLLSDVFQLVMSHKIKLESNFASFILAIMVLEGLGRSLDPDMDMLERSKPFLFGFNR